MRLLCSGQYAVRHFFGFFRLGEILLPSGCTYDSNIHLSVGDVAVDNVEDPKWSKLALSTPRLINLARGQKFT